MPGHRNLNASSAAPSVYLAVHPTTIFLSCRVDFDGYKHLILLVAGAGIEPATYGL